ncbi:MAG: hypothetical protein AB7I18_12835 [Candidatus Berkiella sp.]
MTQQQCQQVSGGYQTPPLEHNEFSYNDWAQYFFCTIVNQAYIEIVNS